MDPTRKPPDPRDSTAKKRETRARPGNLPLPHQDKTAAVIPPAQSPKKGDTKRVAPPKKPDKTVVFSEDQQQQVLKDVDLPRFAEYRLLGKIGEGGMGVVYKAIHEKLNRVVAIKVLTGGEHSSNAQVERFLTEARAAARLSHTNIVPVYDSGEYEGKHYFTMKYVEGETLDAVLTRDPSRYMARPREAVALLLPVIDAIGAAHRQHVIHRDIKPSNIILDQNGTPMVMDFGLAKDLSEGMKLTRTGMAVGTPSYMSPEQARGESRTMDTRTDVYSLGAVLYELVTGRPPFQADTYFETMESVVRDEPTPPARYNPNIAIDLDTIVLKALEKEKPKRYQSTDELSMDLARFLADEPISARPIGAAERWKRKLKRHRGTVIAAGAGLIVVLALTAFFVHHGKSAGEEQAQQGLKDQSLELYHRGKAADDQHNLAEARLLLGQALEKWPGNADAGALRARVDGEIEDRVKELVGAASVEMQHERTAEAAAKLQEALALRPDDPTIKGLLDKATSASAPFEIETKPAGAAVIVLDKDGQAPPERELGKTPVTGKRLPPGTYVVSLALEGYATVRAPILVESGKGQPSRLSVEMVAKERVPEEMVVVPGGEFALGGGVPLALPEQRRTLPTFLIDRHDVTCEEYAQFLAATKRKPPEGWSGAEPPKGKEKTPVVNVTWYDAEAYAKWAKKRLPTEEEWEKAARGIDGRPFPWGRRTEPGLSHVEDFNGGPVAVESVKTDRSPYGCYDMAGNVCQWTASVWTGAAAGFGAMVVRGSSWAHKRVEKGVNLEHCAHRANFPKDKADVFIGFRCAKDP